MRPERGLSFIDETWAETKMARARGRCAERSTASVAKAPVRVQWRTPHVSSAALRCDGLTAPCCHRRTDRMAQASATYVEQVLWRPILSAGRRCRYGQSLGSHKGRAIRARDPRQRKAKLFSCRLLSQTSIRSSRPSPKLKTLLRKADAVGPIEQTWANHRRQPARPASRHAQNAHNYFTHRRTTASSLNRPTL